MDIGDKSQSAQQALTNPPRDNSNQETQQVPSAEHLGNRNYPTSLPTRVVDGQGVDGDGVEDTQE